MAGDASDASASLFRRLLLARDDAANADSPLSGVDHIFLGNGEGVNAAVFGIVVDPFAVMGSDHFPLFADLGL